MTLLGVHHMVTLAIGDTTLALTSMLTLVGVRLQPDVTPRTRRTRRRATESSVSEQQAASTWCNPTSAIVRQPRDNVWVGDRPFIWNKIDVGGRMTFLKLEDGSLMVFAPLHIDSAMRATLQKLGHVKHIVVRM